MTVTLLFVSAPAFADCVSPSGAESQTQYDFTAHVLQYCDGTNWVNLGDSGTGGALSDNDDLISIAMGVSQATTSPQLYSNGFADSYGDTTYIDIAQPPTNLDAGTTGILQPTKSSTNTHSYTLPGSNNNWTGYNVRQLIKAADLSTSTVAPHFVRVSMKGGNGNALVVDSMYIGRAATSGDAYDFFGDQARVTVSGAGNFTIPAGTTVTSDWIPYALDHTKNLVLAMHLSAGDAGWAQSADSSKFDMYNQSSGTDTSAITNTSGLNMSVSGSLLLFSRIEVGNAANNLAVRSAAIPAAAAPDGIRATLKVRYIDSVTPNTDFTVEVSRNNGTTWALGALTDIGPANGTMHTLQTGLINVSSQSSGSSIRYRLKSLHNKRLEFQDVYLSWQ